MLSQFTDFQLTLMGMGTVALIVIGVLLFMKWESHHATTIWNKRIKKTRKSKNHR
jgi:hypothetical protein